MPEVKTIGRSGQISLGKEFAGKHVLIDRSSPGVWVIKLGKFVPDNERWLFEKKVKQDLDKAIGWAEKNPPKATDLKDLEEEIEQNNLED